MMQGRIREFMGAGRAKISIPTVIFGSRHDPLLANAAQMAAELFEDCELAIADERRPFANHALPERAACYEQVVRFLKRRQQASVCGAAR
jgi:hypothetical protein